MRILKKIKTFLFGEEEEEKTFTEIEMAKLLKAATSNNHKETREILYELKTEAEINKLNREEIPEKKPIVSGDTVLKVGTVVFLALLGWHAETTGHLIPKCFTQSTNLIKM